MELPAKQKGINVPEMHARHENMSRHILFGSDCEKHSETLESAPWRHARRKINSRRNEEAAYIVKKDIKKEKKFA